MEYMVGLFALILIPLALIYFLQKRGRNVRRGLILNIVGFFVCCVALTSLNVGAVAQAAAEAAESVGGLTVGDGLGLLGAALATGLSCIGGGIAVASSATAAIGAISEDSKMFGKAIIFVGMAEGVALYGMLVSFQILGKIG